MMVCVCVSRFCKISRGQGWVPRDVFGTWGSSRGSILTEQKCIDTCKSQRQCAAFYFTTSRTPRCWLLSTPDSYSPSYEPESATHRALVRVNNCSEAETGLNISIPEAQYLQGEFSVTNMHHHEPTYFRAGPNVERQLVLARGPDVQSTNHECEQLLTAIKKISVHCCIMRCFLLTPSMGRDSAGSYGFLTLFYTTTPCLQLELVSYSVWWDVSKLVSQFVWWSVLKEACLLACVVSNLSTSLAPLISLWWHAGMASNCSCPSVFFLSDVSILGRSLSYRRFGNSGRQGGLQTRFLIRLYFLGSAVKDVLSTTSGHSSGLLGSSCTPTHPIMRMKSPATRPSSLGK